MPKRLLGLILLLPLLGCPPRTSSDNVAGPEAKLSEVTPYNLRIDFFGLTAFAEDSGKVWAYLVNADYDPTKPDEKALPPGVWDEALAEEPRDENARAKWLEDFFPPHHPWIRLRNARVLEGPSFDPAKGMSIAGAELRFVTDSKTPFKSDLSTLSAAEQIFATRTIADGARDAIRGLDKLDPALVSGRDGRVGARALIESGTVTARPVERCGPRTFTYVLASEQDLPPGDEAVSLAEEVVVTQEGLTGPTRIDLGSGKAIVIEPLDRGQPMIVEVVNQTQHVIDHPPAPDACKQDTHFETFRWFYRLTTADNQAKKEIHYYPFLKDGNFGGDKCPPKRMQH